MLTRLLVVPALVLLAACGSQAPDRVVALDQPKTASPVSQTPPPATPSPAVTAEAQPSGPSRAPAPATTSSPEPAPRCHEPGPAREPRPGLSAEVAGPGVVRPGDDVVFSVTVRSTLDEPQTVDWTHAPAVWLEDDRTGAVVWSSYLRGSTQSIKHLDLPARGERTYRFTWPHEVCDSPSATRPGELAPGSYRLHARWTLHDGHVNATPVAVTAR